MNALRNNEGFTLIELLVAVTIIGVLAAIAIPQFALYRQRAFDAQSQCDLRNAAIAEETIYATAITYVSCTEADCGDLDKIGFVPSGGVKLTMTANSDVSFIGTAKHSNGAVTWSYDSTTGEMTNS